MQQHSRTGHVALAAATGYVLGVYAVFPVALAAACRWRPRPLRLTGPLPASVSVVIAAHDEARSIGDKLDDLAAQRFGSAPALEVIVASDGSTDETVAIAERHPLRPVVLDLPRAGKAAALNHAAARVTGEVVVFTDANSRLGPDALERLLAPFADPEVGGVAGDQRYERRPSGTASSERRYWSLERSLKRWESCIGSVVSSTGALHAVRRDLVEPVPGDVTDDFFLSTGVVCRGRRLVVAPEAVAREIPNERAGAEYRRRVRIITRGLTAIRRRRELLDPRAHGRYSIVLLVHKIARRFVFVPMLVALLGALRGRRWSRVSRWAARGQIGFYAAAAIGAVFPRHRIGRVAPVALAAHFCTANLAAAHAVVNVVRARPVVTWSPERG